MPLLDTRRHQMFPTLDAVQVQTARRFASGPERAFAAGETIYDVGERHAAVWLVLQGSIDIVRRDGLGHQEPVIVAGPGQFTGEVSQLAGRGSLVAGRAGAEGCVAMSFDAAHLRALVIGSAEIGEIVMRAYILRRVGLIEAGGAGAVLVGRPGSPGLVRLQGFLTRNGYPHIVLEATDHSEGQALIERLGVQPDELPLMVCPNGTVLRCPTETAAGTLPRPHADARSGHGL